MYGSSWHKHSGHYHLVAGLPHSTTCLRSWAALSLYAPFCQPPHC